jgi:beta-lactamase class D
VGWIEENRRPYFFVLLVKATKKDQDLPVIRKQLLTDILGHYDFMKGKK